MTTPIATVARVEKRVLNMVWEGDEGFRGNKSSCPNLERGCNHKSLHCAILSPLYRIWKYEIRESILSIMNQHRYLSNQSSRLSTCWDFVSWLQQHVWCVYDRIQKHYYFYNAIPLKWSHNRKNEHVSDCNEKINDLIIILLTQ